jgi:queuine tRNA-ribosyltransferase
MALKFTIDARRAGGRAGRLHTPHGSVETPVFMPVGTVATVKSVPQETLEELGVEILLSNTYHLYLRPGTDLLRSLGGLHKFMSWERPILTDSGGFQVFSLSSLRKVTEQGVEFRSHLDGSAHVFTPESAMAAQIAIGADIMMAFDECTEYPAEHSRVRDTMEMTLRWAQRSRRYFDDHKQEVPWAAQREGEKALFGIVQGGLHADLRRESAERTVEIGFGGYAMGGFSVGEPRAQTREIVAETLPYLPEEKPRYLMGVGTPAEIALYAHMGVDMMDCVLPTRAARHGLLYTSEGRLSIKSMRYARDEGPLDPQCGCKVCGRYSRAYLRHLYAANESLAGVLNTVHNLAFYLDTMRAVRHSIRFGDVAGSHSAESSRRTES